MLALAQAMMVEVEGYTKPDHKVQQKMIEAVAKSTNLAVNEVEIKLNDESFNDFVRDLNPEIVLFDRFMIEEQYSWRVTNECPNAMKILDTEDLHFLRNARQNASKKGIEFTNDLLFSDLAKREIAAILRCDLSLIISKQEIEILQNQFKIDESLLYYLPFLEESITKEKVDNWANIYIILFNDLLNNLERRYK